jgi:hypothetical protein
MLKSIIGVLRFAAQSIGGRPDLRPTDSNLTSAYRAVGTATTAPNPESDLAFLDRR